MLFGFYVIFLFKQKTAYEMRISDWSSDVCSSDLEPIISVYRVRPKPCALIGVGQTAGEIVGQPKTGCCLYAINDRPLSVTRIDPRKILINLNQDFTLEARLIGR